MVPVYDERPAARVMAPAGQAHWPGGNFGRRIASVRSIVAHLTAGWPRRDGADAFVQRYIVPGTPKRGLGPQFYISGDGTTARLIDLPRRTGHAEFTNSWALGVETGNLGDQAPPPSVNWVQASTDAEDIPGAKLWITSRRAVHTEVLPAWWTTASYAGPGRGAIGAGHMLFSEWAYRSWAVLARYVFEQFGVPRNFPLLPHESRSGMMTASAAFRRIVVADERAEMMKRAFAAAPLNIQAVSFEPANAAALQTAYVATIVGTTAAHKRHNRAWRKFFDVYRGLHGHGFSGAIGRHVNPATGNLEDNHDHDCPGPLFDFHRIAREVWDWWWYPFDAAEDTTAVPRRPYRRFRADTPLIEYYFDERESMRTAHTDVGVHGNQASPTTFSLNPQSPIYAMANGELVAARFPPPGAGVSMAFALVRHEVFHRLFIGPLAAGTAGGISYARPPSSVYTLYMHLGRPAGMSFERVSDDNPDWLNRVLIRKKECDLGVAFYDGDPAHHGIAAAVWNNRPPGVPQRPTTLEAWRADQAMLTTFLDTLRRGDIAVLPHEPFTQAIRILLGDFLGESGVIRRRGTATTHGIRIEAFAPELAAPTFSLTTGGTGWNPPAGKRAPHCLQYQSEWARIVPTDAERSALEANGVDLSLIGWWHVVALEQRLDPSLPANARLPFTGVVFHYQPLDFAKWINDVTWTHEWPKYEVLDAAGNPVTPRPARPRTRRL